MTGTRWWAMLGFMPSNQPDNVHHSLWAALRETGHPKATTGIVQEAIDRAAADASAHGGMVIIPPGTWTITTLYLRSGVTLHLSRGAVLKAHTDLADYPTHTRGHNKDRTGYHLIMAQDCDQITISGDGVIDGNGTAFWEPPIRDLRAQGKDVTDDIARAPAHWPIDGPWWRGWKPRISPMLEIRNCRDVVLRDVIFRNSPGWTIHPYCCDRVRIDGITIDDHLYGPNTDGIDINGCRDVIISNCTITGCDDSIILKATQDARSTERVTVTNCILTTNCAALGLGAETSQSIRDVTFSNCIIRQALRMVQFEMWNPGTIENVAISNLSGRTMTPEDVPMEKVIYMDIQHHGRTDGALGHMRNIHIEGITAVTRGRCIMTATEGAMISDVTLRGIHLRYPEIEDAAELIKTNRSSQNNNDNPEARKRNAVVVAENVHRLWMEDIRAAMPAAGTETPRMGGMWLSKVDQARIDCPWLAPNHQAEPIEQHECRDIDVRAIGRHEAS
ncbi:MAG: right-handed parallel beta-helix repeat-containing protein [Phycisphaeraceae bacterium]|nr:right-handed parallel beta-helix repeat-containing protein [Phycisphaeraceae bacterium]